MSRIIECNFGLCDRMNPSVGYQINIKDAMTGETILSASRHPVTGADLLTARDCVEVAVMYEARNRTDKGIIMYGLVNKDDLYLLAVIASGPIFTNEARNAMRLSLAKAASFKNTFNRAFPDAAVSITRLTS